MLFSKYFNSRENVRNRPFILTACLLNAGVWVISSIRMWDMINITYTLSVTIGFICSI